MSKIDEMYVGRWVMREKCGKSRTVGPPNGGDGRRIRCLSSQASTDDCEIVPASGEEAAVSASLFG